MNVFIDSNILVYAHDAEAGDRHEKARSLIADIWEKRRIPALSVQVLQEVHVNLVRKKTPVDEAARRVSRYLQWRVVDNSKALFLRSLEIQQRWQLSFWDSSIVAAALQSQAGELWSEDLNEGQVIEGMVFRNPLR